jgi:uncharacterized protein YbjT (DUF2867 family)
MILVTGATGNVGRNVVEQLLAAGEVVRALTRNPAGAGLDSAVDTVFGDLSRPETLAGALRGVERAFLFPVHGQLQAFLDIAKDNSVDLVVLLSSSSVIMDQPNSIARLHIDSEEVVQSSGLAWTFVRPGAFMTNDLRWAPGIKAGGVVRAPYGEAAASCIDERDIAAVAVAALQNDGHAEKSYTLSGPESLTQVERVDLLSEAIGRPVRFEEQSPDAFRQQMSAMPSHVADSLLGLLASSVGTTAPITDTVQEVTGRSPHTYRQWAAHHVADFTE